MDENPADWLFVRKLLLFAFAFTSARIFRGRPVPALSGIRALALLPATVFLAIALNSCAGRSHGTMHGKYGGTLELVNGDDFKSLDPAHGYDVPAWGIERLLYNGLLDYDQNANLAPNGATSYEVSPDARTYTFHLRHDMHFEGPITKNRLVTSQDFAYEIQRVLDPKVASPGFDFFSAIVGAEEFKAERKKDKPATVSGLRTPDDFTLVIQLTKPGPAFIYIMALPFSYAVPREVVEKYGEPDFTEHAEGSGPFTLASYRRNVDITLAKNPHYWKPGLPYVDRIHSRFGIGALNSMMMFETGELGLSGIPAPDFVRITHDAQFARSIVKQSELAIYYISLNCEIPPLDNVKVRQAINYAIDRDRILKMLNYRGILAKGVLPPGMPGYDPALQGYSHDPARARQLLKEAGFPKGFTTTLWVRSAEGSGEEMQQAQAIQQDLKDVGINLDLHPVTFSVWLTAVAEEKKVPMSVNRWFQDFPDPSDFLDVLLNSRQAVDKSGNNNAFYKSPAMDALLNKAASETNPAKRMELYKAADRLAVHDAPWVFLYYPIGYELHQPWVQGFRLHPVWPAVYEQVWLSGK